MVDVTKLMSDYSELSEQVRALEARVRRDNDRMNALIRRHSVLQADADDLARMVIEGRTPKPGTLRDVSAQIKDVLFNVAVIRVASIIDGYEELSMALRVQAAERERERDIARAEAETMRKVAEGLVMELGRERARAAERMGLTLYSDRDGIEDQEVAYRIMAWDAWKVVQGGVKR